MQEPQNKSWSPVWEQIFRSRTSWNKYPPEELVRFFAANFYACEPRAVIKVLELGCGPGAGGSRYVAREGFSFYGIDGSAKAVEVARDTFRSENLLGTFVVGDIQQLPYPDDYFDCVFDIACLQCNSESASRRAIMEVLRVLKPGGKHFSLTAKAGSWGDGTGQRVDATSFRDVTEGPYVGMDIARFATIESLQTLYEKFRDLQIDFSVRSVDGQSHEIGHWMVTARK